MIAATQVGLQAAGTGLQIAGAMRQGKAQADAARFNSQQQAAQATSEARLQERQAQIAEHDLLAEVQTSAFENRQARKVLAQRASERRAVTGAAGIEATGSALDVAVREAGEMELELAAMEHASQTRQQALRDEARLTRFTAGEIRREIPTMLAVGRRRARLARQEGTFAAIGAGIAGAEKIGTTLLTPKKSRESGK